MKKKKILATILLTVSTLALTACGNTANTVSVEETTKNQVVENTTTAESESEVQESTTGNNVVKENKEATTETAVVEQNETAESADSKIEFNGAGHTGTLEETVQSYITYESIDPVTMYVISNTTGERYSTYHDPNVSEGELVVSGLVDANQELQIDGKATHNGVDYYRLVFQEEMMLNHQIIIPADLLTTEPQEVQQQQPEVQQPEVQQPEVQQQPEQTPPPASENNTPEWTPDTGVSKEDWDAFFGGGNTTGQHTWTPDRGEGAYVDENGNVWDSSLQEGVLEFH